MNKQKTAGRRTERASRPAASSKQGGWAGRAALSLAADDLNALLSGRVAYLRFPNFLEPRWCDEISRRFLETKPRVYAEKGYGPNLTYELGHSLDQLYREKAAYFENSPKLMAALRKLYSGGDDPLLKLCAWMTRATLWSYVEARQDGRRYCSDVIGNMLPGSTLPLHNDKTHLDAKMAMALYDRIISVNTYLMAPDEGGEVVMYRRPWQPEDNELRTEGFFDARVVAGAEHAVYRPIQGEMIMFAADQYHEVRTTRGHRMVAHCFLGVAPQKGHFTSWG